MIHLLQNNALYNVAFLRYRSKIWLKNRKNRGFSLYLSLFTATESNWRDFCMKNSVWSPIGGKMSWVSGTPEPFFK